MALLTCALGVLFVDACSSKTYVIVGGTCQSGERDPCLGDGDCQGVRVCNEDGQYGPCLCETSSGGAQGTAGGDAGTMSTGGSRTGGTSGAFGLAGSVQGGQSGGGDGNVGGVAGDTSEPTGGSSGASTSGGSPSGGEAGMMTGGSGGGGTSGTGGTSGSAGMSGTGAVSGGAGTSGAGGSGGSAGSSGTGAGGSGGSGVTLEQLVGALDGRLIQMPCGDQPSTDDCNSAGYIMTGSDGMVAGSCQQGRLELVADHPIGGTPGVPYLATMHFYGIMDPRHYQTVERESTVLTNANTGVTPPSWAWHTTPGGAVRESTYSNYEIHVFDDNDAEIATYYLNADGAEGHYTYVINYAKTITIVGGGFVRLRIFDSNCRQIKNCGATFGYPCANKARTLDLSAADPQPSGLNQPSLGVSDDHAGQWWFIDVTGFTEL